jgi:FtsP/CotA-like multicopper oxidase with cupredoxin domain
MTRLCSFAVLAGLLVPVSLSAQTICPRSPAGSIVTAPLDLHSANGVLTVNLQYQTDTDAYGNTLFCFTDSKGRQSPSLYVNPGDTIVMNVTNGLSATGSAARAGAHHVGPHSISMNPQATVPAVQVCGSSLPMSPASVNVHFHGTNTPPTCHQDEVIRTLINPGESFQYTLQIPADEPPGLYWYHPHVHGISEAAVLGGASGAIVVQGIQNVNPIVGGLHQQLLIIRDNPPVSSSDDAPQKDLSLNYIPVYFPEYKPAIIAMDPGLKQLWRVLNASADTIMDLQVVFDGSPQALTIVALDGVPTGSQDGTQQGQSYNVFHVYIPPAGRAEFVVSPPSGAVKSATLITRGIDTGPSGDFDPMRPLANIVLNSPTAPILPSKLSDVLPFVSKTPPKARFSNLAAVTPTATRNLYFSEVALDPNDPDAFIIFFITVAGQQPVAFNADNPPAIVTTQGAVEDWIIENRSMENHEFHMHQIHFLVMAQNGVPLENQQFMDTVNVPYWSGTGPYPSVTVRMDFRGAVVGDFVYHCHILAHEDGGMMAIIRVNAASTATTGKN